MRNNVLKLTARFALLAAALWFSLAPVSSTAAGCGLKPLKPLVPLGCKDLVPQCVCARDAKTGLMNCYWQWLCVKR